MMMGIDTSWLLVAAGFVGAIVTVSYTHLDVYKRQMRAWILLNSGWGKALTSGTPGINAPHWRGLALTWPSRCCLLYTSRCV